MSITTLKRKTDGQYHVKGGQHGHGFRNVISRKPFSLNDPRRVDAHTGEPSVQSRMRGTAFRGYGTKNGYMVKPIFSSYQNAYDPYNVPRVSRPLPKPSCPVVQNLDPISYAVQYSQATEAIMKKEACAPKVEPVCQKTCNGSSLSTNSNIVKKLTHSYQDVLSRRKKPLPPGQEHFPPNISRNSTQVCTTKTLTPSDFRCLMLRRCNPNAPCYEPVPAPPVPAPILPISTTFQMGAHTGGVYMINYPSLMNPTLTLTRGTTYNIIINAGGWGFWIQTEPGLYNPGFVYNSGVTNNGEDVGTIVFDVPEDSPNTLYYVTQVQLETYDFHGGIIQIV
jgi:hypothetical protein